MAGRNYRIDPDLLRAIAWHESKNNNAAIGKNKDGTVDIGIMQINSRNFNHLEEFGITQQHLKKDPCINIYTGAYYLAIAFNKMGTNWQAIGAYNAGFKASKKQSRRRYEYARKIEQIYQIIKKKNPSKT